MATLQDLQNYANQQAGIYGLNPSIFSWQINQESSWNPNAKNGNASGIAQFMPATAQQYGVNTSDPYSSINGAARYMQSLLAKFGGNYTKALTSYGTLANAPSSVLNSYNSMMAGQNTGVTGNLASGSMSGSNASGSAPTGIPASGFFTRVAIGLLAIVVIGGAIYTYKG